MTYQQYVDYKKLLTVHYIGYTSQIVQVIIRVN